jgi:hypothetical protein
MARKSYGAKGGTSGPTKAAGHIDSVMGREYPSMMGVRGHGRVGSSTANRKKSRGMR